jgi:hypothetical protein
LSRIAPALLLLFLSPVVAEFLLGDIPITKVSFLLAFLPMYGCGAILIREVVRRTGRGWPTMLVLALAYGVLEEGITTMSLFNPNYAGAHLLAYGLIPVLGMSPVWTIYVLTLHVVWSIGTPIAIAEAVAGGRRTTPWLGKIGLWVVSVFFVLGVAMTTFFSLVQYTFVASPAQLIGVVVVLAALIALAVYLPRLAGAVQRPATGSAPNPWLVGVVGTVAAFVFQGLWRWMTGVIPAWLLVVLALAVFAITIALVTYWSARPGWGGVHILALATGAVLNYGWIGIERVFSGDVIKPLHVTPVDEVGQVVLLLVILGLVGWGASRLRKTHVPATAAELDGASR